MRAYLGAEMPDAPQINPLGWLAKIKFGYGLPSKIGLIALGGIAVGGGIGLTLILAGYIVAGCAFSGAAMLTAFWFGERLLRLVEKNPVAALTEGAEYQRIYEIQQAAKDKEYIDVTPNVTANTNPPQSITSGGS